MIDPSLINPQSTSALNDDYLLYPPPNTDLEFHDPSQDYPSPSMAFQGVNFLADSLDNAPDALDALGNEGMDTEEDFVANGSFVCDQRGCDKVFPRQCDLTKHQRNHSRPISCQFCPRSEFKGVAQNKDLYRHYWIKHPEWAAANNIPKEEATCPRCGKTKRSDNIKRHRERCKG